MSNSLLAPIVLAAAVAAGVAWHAERHRVRHAALWAIGVFLALIVFLPAYMVHVRRLRRAGKIR